MVFNPTVHQSDAVVPEGDRVTWVDAPYVQLAVGYLLILFQAVYRPLWTGFGILALYGVILLIVTSMLQRKIGARVSLSLFVVLLMVRMTKGAKVHGSIHTSR